MIRHLLDTLRSKLRASRTAGPVILAVLIGILAGFGAIALRHMIRAVQWLSDTPFDRVADGASGWFGSVPWAFLVMPPIGLLLVRWITTTWAPEAAGHGIPEVQFAVRNSAGKLRPRLILVKSLTSSITIGTGGSAGREGPIVQIGSALGSLVGQFVALGPNLLKVLVACGAAGAVGATFNAPIAGVMFALEVILGSFAAQSFGLVVISAVTATAISHAYLGDEPAFRLAEAFSLVHEAEFGLYLVLGVVMGLTATLFIRLLYGVQDGMARWKIGPNVKAILGGLLIGGIGLFGSELVLGTGDQGIELALAGELTLGLMALLVLLKLLATTVTLSAGGSGGVFAPSLFMGAMAGGAFGAIVHTIFPGWTAPPGAYALVGMAAMFGGTAHAPITGILILFEMTDNYQIILPLMLAVVMSYLIASRILNDSIYSVKLRRKGAFTEAREVSTLDVVLVADAMSERFETVNPDMGLTEFEALAHSRRTGSWPVVDEGGRLLGIVTETDLERQFLQSEDELTAEERQELRVSDIMTHPVRTCEAGDSLRTAFRAFAERDVQQIPVTDPEDSSVVVGVLRRHEMLWAYRQLADEHQALLERAEGRLTSPGERTLQISVAIPHDDHRFAGRLVRHVRVPPHALIALIRRAEETFVPRGDTRLEADDTLTLVSTAAFEDELREWAVEVEGRSGHGAVPIDVDSVRPR